MKFLFASTNSGKFEEARSFAGALRVILIAPSELSAHSPIPTIQESGTTYRENARLKAQGFYRWSGLPVIADDSGLEVSALHGAPGLFSARYAGEGASATQNNQKLLQALEGIEDRSARMVCDLIAYISPETEFHAHGVLAGEILTAPIGTGGFGYDALFKVEGTGDSLAQLKAQGSALETHRLMALRLLFGQIDLTSSRPS